MTTGVALDLKRITAEVAARHGMLLRPDDPAMLLVTMNEVVLQQVQIFDQQVAPALAFTEQ